ncbi:MAG: rhomboid family intramembrane serine protease [bacterium]|nr:rhomboid family intramembrane serine protease [bacterium]
MSIFDRDYFYQRTNSEWGRSPYDGSGRVQPGMTPAVRWLVIVNVAVFLGVAVLTNAGVPFFRHGATIEIVSGEVQQVIQPSDFERWFGLFTPYLLGRGFVWQFVTYQFLHGGLLHLFFNMFALYMLGAALERQIGAVAFTRLYLLGGVFAGFVNIVPHIFVEYPTIGASGAVCAIVAAFGLLNPQARLMLFLWFVPVVVKARTMVILYALWTAMQALGSNDGIAHLAHLGGLVFGWMYVYNLSLIHI